MKKLLTIIPAFALGLAILAAPATAKAADPKGKAIDGKVVRGNEAKGAKVFDQKGEHLGEIDDIIFDENTGGMTHAVLALGGWLGIGEKLTAVPWKFIKQSEKDSPGYVVDVEKSKLTAAEHFDDNNWPDMSGGWYQKSYTSYGLTGKTGEKLVRLSKVEGAQVFDQKGEQIGEIKDVLLHPNSGKVAYGIISMENDQTVGDKLTSVPWSLIRQSKKDTEGFVVNVDKAKLDTAPHFESNSWPDYSDPAWNSTTYGYYGANPYWTSPMLY